VEARFQVLVERFAVPSESDMGMFLDGQGMLAAPSFAGHGDGGLPAIRALASRGSFSLLGEPGAGKTTALKSIIGGIPEPDAAEPGQDAVLVVPLGEIADRSAFRELVTGPVLARVPVGAPRLEEPLPPGIAVAAGRWCSLRDHHSSVPEDVHSWHTQLQDAVTGTTAR
jgi:hypothetical protein